MKPLILHLLLAASLAANPLVMLSGNAGGGADITAPTLASATVNGSVLTLNWSEAVTGNSGYLAALDVDLSITGSNITIASHSSGNGTATWEMVLASPAVAGETANFDFTTASDLIEDAAGNDLATITDGAVTNTTADPILLNETFEGPGLVETWSVGTWNDASYATSPAPLVGSYSGMKNTSNSYVYHDLGSLKTHLFGKMLVNAAVVNNSDSLQFMRLYDSSGTANGDVAAFVSFIAGPSKNLMRLGSNHGYTTGAGTEVSAGSTTFPEATDMYLWWEWQASTGANDGVFKVWYNTTDDFSTKTLVGAGTTNGNRTDGVQRIAFSGFTGATWIFDSIQISETVIE